MRQCMQLKKLIGNLKRPTQDQNLQCINFEEVPVYLVTSKAKLTSDQ